MDSLKEAVSQGCPKLQHLRFSWYEGDGYIEEVINGIRGMQTMGSQIVLLRGLGPIWPRHSTDLVSHHSKSLEEVEVVLKALVL